MKRLLQGLTALFLFLSAVSFAVIVTLHFRPLYYWDIGRLSIADLSGLTETEIRENYDALIDYNIGFSSEKLRLPSLPSSAEGQMHFAEVRGIFHAFCLVFAGSVLFSVLLIYILRREKPWYWLLSSILSAAVPALIGISIALDWEKSFLAMHRLFFRNTYWYFDPATDPVILILPSEYFMHCGILIVLLVFFAAAVFLGIYLKKKKKTVSPPENGLGLEPLTEEKLPAFK